MSITTALTIGLCKSLEKIEHVVVCTPHPGFSKSLSTLIYLKKKMFILSKLSNGITVLVSFNPLTIADMRLLHAFYF